MAYHSFAGTLHRRKIAAAKRGSDGAAFSLTGKADAVGGWPSALGHEDGVAKQRSLASGGRFSFYQNMFHNAYKSLYRTENSYSRLLAESNAADEGSETAAGESVGDHGNGGESTTHQEHEGEDLAHELSIEVSFEDTYKILVFLGTVFVFGEIAGYCGVPSLVGQIVAGFLLGPPLAEFVPFPEAVRLNSLLQNQLLGSLLSLLRHICLSFLISHSNCRWYSSGI